MVMPLIQALRGRGRTDRVQNKAGLHKDFQTRQGYLLSSDPISLKTKNKQRNKHHKKLFVVILVCRTSFQHNVCLAKLL